MEFHEVQTLTPAQLFMEMQELARNQATVIREQQRLLEQFRIVFGRLQLACQSGSSLPTSMIISMLLGVMPKGGQNEDS